MKIGINNSGYEHANARTNPLYNNYTRNSFSDVTRNIEVDYFPENVFNESVNVQPETHANNNNNANIEFLNGFYNGTHENLFEEMNFLDNQFEQTLVNTNLEDSNVIIIPVNTSAEQLNIHTQFNYQYNLNSRLYNSCKAFIEFTKSLFIKVKLSVMSSANKIKCLAEVEKCPVCLDVFFGCSKPFLLKCKHKFHKDCIKKWLINPCNTCPVCRRMVFYKDRPV
jgi:hypothetical protein